MPEQEPGVFGKMRRRSLSCVAQRFAVLLIVWYVGGSTGGRSNIKKLRGSHCLLSKQSHAQFGQRVDSTSLFLYWDKNSPVTWPTQH